MESRTRRFMGRSFQSGRPTIVVLAHKRTEHLAKCLDAIRLADGVEDHHLVVVVDGHDNGVLAVVRGYSKPAVLITVDNPDAASPRFRILRSLSLGLSAAFDVELSAYAIVIEDDIVIAPDFLRAVSSVMAAHSRRRFFRAVNGFGTVAADAPGERNSYSRLSFGVGWGWAIPQKTYRIVKKIFAVGADSQIWDALIEPYLRTGYVVNFRRSRVRNIGFDLSATHTTAASDLSLGLLLDRSFVSDAPNSDVPCEFRQSGEPFFWREDAIALDRLPAPLRLSVYLSGWLGWMFQRFVLAFESDSKSRWRSLALRSQRFIRKRVFPRLGKLSGSGLVS